MNFLKRIWVWILLTGLLVGLVLFARDYFSFYYPLPRAGTGAVIGKLDLGTEADRGYTAQDLYLAPSLESSQSNMPPVVAFSYATDPHPIAYDSNGRFAFTNVPPGNYALIIWHPGFSFVLESAEGRPHQVTVAADQIINLGTIVPQQ